MTELEQADTAPLLAPLEFTRTGYYLWSSAALRNRGSYGYFWSGRSYSSISSYYLYFSSTLVYPQDGYNRGNGFTFRCLAR